MVSKELGEAAVEINSIFENMSIDVLNKIPTSFQEMFKEIKSKEYKFEYDKTKKLNEQKLLPKTKGILALIYRDFLCNANEKENYNKEYNKYLLIKEQEKYVKYNPEDLFKKKEDDINNNLLPVEYKKSLISRILDKFKKIIKKA